MNRLKITLFFLLCFLQFPRLSAQWMMELTDTIAVKSWYFDVGKSSLSDRQAASLDSMFHFWSQKVSMEKFYWSLTACTDTVGSTSDNEQLARLRLNAVRDLLLAKGLREAQIPMQTTMPEERPDTRGLAYNRRVTVQFEHRHWKCWEGNQPDCFCFYPGRDTSFMSKAGTVVLLKGTAFKLPTGPENCVSVCLREAYSRAAIILQDLQTESNGTPMISEGMVRIEASVGAQPLELEPGQSVTYLVPTAKPVKGMSGWSGERMADGRLNFNGGDHVAATFRALADDCADVLVRKRAMDLIRCNYDLRCGSLDSLLRARLVNCTPCKFFWCKLRMFFKRIVSRSARQGQRIIRRNNRGNNRSEIPMSAADFYTPVEIEKLISDSKEALDLRDSLKELDSRLKKLNVSPCIKQMRQRDSVLAALGYENQSAYLDSLWLGRERRGAETVKFGKSIPANAMDYYVLTATNLSWQNLDLLMKYPPEKRRDLLVKNVPGGNTRVFLSMNNFNTVLSGKVTAKGYLFAFIPIGEPFKLVALTLDGGSYTYGEMAVATVGKQSAVGPIAMKPISAVDLRTRLAKLEQK